jgi:hypothetical protein
MVARTLGLSEAPHSGFGAIASSFGEALRQVRRGISTAKDLREGALGAHDGEDGSAEHLRKLAMEFARLQRG